MPTYQYRCTNCGHELEVVQKFSDPALTVCDQCQGTLRKVYNPVGVVFKGSGFYATDNRTKGAAKAATSSESSSSESSATSSTSSSSASSTPSSGTSTSGGSGAGSTSSTSSTPAAKPASGGTPAS